MVCILPGQRRRSPPQIVTAGPLPYPAGGVNQGPFIAVSASPDLTQVAFQSAVPIDPGDTCNRADVGSTVDLDSTNTYLWNATTDPLAHPIVSAPPTCALPTPNVGTTTEPSKFFLQTNAAPTILPDGRPLVYPSPPGPLVNDSNHLIDGNPLGPGAYTVGPLVVDNRDTNSPGALTPLTGPSGAAFLANSPDGSTAYLGSADPLDADFPAASGQQVYAVSTTQGTGWQGGSEPVPAVNGSGETPGVTCLSCDTGPGNAAYAGLSKDGSHLFFTTASGALWSYDFAAAQPLDEIAPESAHASVQAVSQNGRHVVASTGSGPTEYNQGASPQPIDGCGTAVGVSDDGARVVCSDGNEWVDGNVTQIFQGTFQAVAGDQLQDVFFLSNRPLLPSDFNAGATDIYDARLDGGFPTPPQCSGDACQGAPSTPPVAPPPPASQTFSGPANPPPVPVKKCGKGKVRRNGRCVNRKANRRHRTRPADTDRRAAR